MKMRKLIATASTGAAMMMVLPASAAIIIYDDPGSLQPAENVLLPGNQNALTVFGNTNQTNTSVTFHSLNSETLQTPANGQARIRTADGTLDALEFFLTQPTVNVFRQVEFNLNNASRGSTMVTLMLNGGNSYSHSIGNGQNFFSALATGSDFFTHVQFDTNGNGVADIRQVRIGGIGAIAAVPEATTWAMMIAGFGFIGAAMRRRQGKIALA
jgi:PEP-CTERM motif